MARFQMLLPIAICVLVYGKEEDKEEKKEEKSNMDNTFFIPHDLGCLSPATLNVRQDEWVLFDK